MGQARNNWSGAPKRVHFSVDVEAHVDLATGSKLRKREESNHNPGPNRLVHQHPQDGAKVLNGQSNLSNGVGHAPALEAGAVVVTTAAAATTTPAAVPAAAAPAAPASAPAVAPGSPSASSASEDDSSEEKDAPLEFVLWSYPTSPSTCGTQLSLYSGDQDTLVHALPYEEPGDCKPGFRKNLRGKWKRLVKKKPPTPDVYTIPPELRDQLKQIYVY